LKSSFPSSTWEGEEKEQKTALLHFLTALLRFFTGSLRLLENLRA